MDMKENLERHESEEQMLAARMESRVIEGNIQILDEEERKKLREAVTRKGVNLEIFMGNIKERKTPGVGRNSRQAKEVELGLGGKERFIEYCQLMLSACVSGDKQKEAEGFVAKYYTEHTKDGYLHFNMKKDPLKNRLEAIISATHNMFELSAKVGEYEAQDFMVSEEFAISVRERVLRGWEKMGFDVNTLKQEVSRNDAEIVRTLPLGGFRKIVEYWVE